jgi:Eukaryotic protein of unknown function (DUF953)
MPIIEIYSPEAYNSALESLPNGYILFFASKVNQKSWCPDCEAIEQDLQVFHTSSTVLIKVYVGDSSEWRSNVNYFRNLKEYKITNLPTLVCRKSKQMWIEEEITSNVLEAIQK